MVSSLSPQHQILICETYALTHLWHVWSTLQTELVNEGPYKASIGRMRLKLQELQEADSEAQELKQPKANSYKEIDEILHYQGLLFIPKAIQTKLMSRHRDNCLAGHFSIKKLCKLLAWKYYWSTLRHNVEAYVKGCNVCLALKAVRHKLYNDFQLLCIPMHK